MPRINLSKDQPRRRPLSLYLVEDSLRVRELLLDFLHLPGEIEIVGYSDTEDASVADIAARPVDAVIVDLKLKAGSGLRVLARLRELNFRPPPVLIVFTNHTLPEIRSHAIALGADYFFDKSEDYARVLNTLKSLQVK